LGYRVIGVLSGTITDDELSAERNPEPVSVVTQPNVTQVGQFAVGKKEKAAAVQTAAITDPSPVVTAAAHMSAAALDAGAVSEAKPAAPADTPEIPPAEQAKLLRAAITDKVPGLKGADFKRYMMGWFRVASDKALPADAVEYLAPLQKLLGHVEGGTANCMEMADVSKQRDIGALLTTIPLPAVAGPAPATTAKPITKSVAAGLTEMGWSEQTALLGAKIMEIRGQSEADLFGYLKQIKIDPADDGEVYALLSISLHTRDGFKVANEAHRAGTTVAGWAAFIEKELGVRLLDKDCDSAKVQDCIDTALIAAAKASA
jgi:hypothetical protein